MRSFELAIVVNSFQGIFTILVRSWLSMRCAPCSVFFVDNPRIVNSRAGSRRRGRSCGEAMISDVRTSDKRLRASKNYPLRKRDATHHEIRIPTSAVSTWLWLSAHSDGQTLSDSIEDVISWTSSKSCPYKLRAGPAAHPLCLIGPLPESKLSQSLRSLNDYLINSDFCQIIRLTSAEICKLHKQNSSIYPFGHITLA